MVSAPVTTIPVDDFRLLPLHDIFSFLLKTASEVYPERNRDMEWDVMYGSKIEGFRGPSGRLLQYDPSTDKITVLVQGLYFANGVAVAEDESYLVFVETYYSRVSKYYLTGKKKGTIENMIDGHPSPACKSDVDIFLIVCRHSIYSTHP